METLISEKINFTVSGYCGYTNGLYYQGPIGRTGPGSPEDTGPITFVPNCVKFTVSLKESNQEDYQSIKDFLEKQKLLDPEIKIEINSPTQTRTKGEIIKECQEKLETFQTRNQLRRAEFDQCLEKLEALGVSCDSLYCPCESTDSFYQWYESINYCVAFHVFCHEKTKTYLWLKEKSLIPTITI